MIDLTGGEVSEVGKMHSLEEKELEETLQQFMASGIVRGKMRRRKWRSTIIENCVRMLRDKGSNDDEDRQNAKKKKAGKGRETRFDSIRFDDCSAD